MKVEAGKDFLVKAVYLDGELIENCIMADTETKTVEYYKRDHKGNFIVTHDQELVRESKKGKVSIVMCDGVVYE